MRKKDLELVASIEAALLFRIQRRHPVDQCEIYEELGKWIEFKSFAARAAWERLKQEQSLENGQ